MEGINTHILPLDTSRWHTRGSLEGPYLQAIITHSMPRQVTILIDHGIVWELPLARASSQYTTTGMED